MARINYRSSLFLYSVEEGDDTPIIIFWRATVYTWWKPAKKSSLRSLLEEYTDDELIEPKRVPEWAEQTSAWETEQVESYESRGLGFYWVDVSFAEQRGSVLIRSETRIEVIHLPTWEKAHVRRGYGILQEFKRALRIIRDTADAMASLFGGTAS